MVPWARILNSNGISIDAAVFAGLSCQTGFNNRFDNGFDNRLYRVYKHLPGCQTGLTTGLTTLYRVNGALLHARYSSSGRQPNFAALSRGRHLYSTGRSSRRASAHILVIVEFADAVMLGGPIPVPILL